MDCPDNFSCSLRIFYCSNKWIFVWHHGSKGGENTISPSYSVHLQHCKSDVQTPWDEYGANASLWSEHQILKVWDYLSNLPKKQAAYEKQESRPRVSLAFFTLWVSPLWILISRIVTNTLWEIHWLCFSLILMLQENHFKDNSSLRPLSLILPCIRSQTLHPGESSLASYSPGHRASGPWTGRLWQVSLTSFSPMTFHSLSIW